MDIRTPVLRALLERALSGYEVMRLLRKTAPVVPAGGEGMIHPVLRMLEHRNLVRGRWRTAAKGRKRRYYSLTLKGRKWLARNASPST